MGKFVVSKADSNNRRKDTREQILNVAQEIIRTQGVKALSIRKIAEKLCIQPPSLYTHYPSIDAILEAVSVRVYRSFANIQSELTGVSPSTGLEIHIEGLVDHMVKNPIYIQLMLHDFAALHGGGGISSAVEAEINKSINNVQFLLDNGATAGKFRKASADEYLAYIFGAGLISLSWGGFDTNGDLIPVVPIARIKKNLLLMAKAFLAI